MNQPRIAICSLFRDSASYVSRWLAQRRRLDYPREELCHVCIEGDSTDSTYQRLHQAMRQLPNMKLRKVDTNRPRFGSVVHPSRFANLSYLANIAIDLAMEWEPTYILWLESDLEYEGDLLDRLLTVHGDIVAPMVLRRHSSTFYDTWAFRRGRSPESRTPVTERFSPEPPYHPDLKPGKPFELDSAGSAMLIDAKVIESGARFTVEEVIVGFCREARSRGYRILLDPSTVVYHPRVRTPKAKTLRERLPLLKQRMKPPKLRRKTPPWERKTVGRFQRKPPIDSNAYALGKRLGYARPLEYAWTAQRLERHDALTLDFGTGNSELPAYLASRALPVVCVDRHDFRGAHTRHQKEFGVTYSFVQCDGLKLPFPTATFDQCVAISSVEHERDDRTLMSEISRVCKPHGRILLTVPYDHFCFWWDGDRPDGGQYYYDLTAAIARLVHSIEAELVDFSFVRYHLPVESLGPYFTHPSNAGVLMMELKNAQ